jgi:hypothetical protein
MIPPRDPSCEGRGRQEESGRATQRGTHLLLILSLFFPLPTSFAPFLFFSFLPASASTPLLTAFSLAIYSRGHLIHRSSLPPSLSYVFLSLSSSLFSLSLFLSPFLTLHLSFYFSFFLSIHFYSFPLVFRSLICRLTIDS